MAKPGDADDLWLAYGETGSARAAGQAFGLGPATVRARLIAAGYALGPVGPRPRPGTPEELWEAYQETGSARRAGERFGLSGDTVGKRLKAAGYVLTGKGGVTPKPGSADELWEAYQETESLVTVGERFNLHYTTVRARLIAAGHEVFPGQRRFSESDLALIAAHFESARDGRSGQGKEELANALGRSVVAIDRQASKMGLTDQAAPRLRLRRWIAEGPDSYSDEQLKGLLDRLERSGLPVSVFCEQEKMSPSAFTRAMRSRLPDAYRAVLGKRGFVGDTPYDLGLRFEQRVEHELRLRFQRFSNTLEIRLSPGSRGPADIIVVLGPYRYLIQAKLFGRNFTPREWNKLIDATVETPSLPIFAAQTSDLELHFWLLTERRDGRRRPRADSWVEVSPTAEGMFLPVEPATEERFLTATESWRDSLPNWPHYYE